MPEKLIDAAKRTGRPARPPRLRLPRRERRLRRGRCGTPASSGSAPIPSSIAAMGSKTESRARMKAAGVPIVPGMTTPAKDAAEIAAFGREHGFPLLLKAAAGGGGKGMRVVRSEEEVPAAFERARSEATLVLRRRGGLLRALRREARGTSRSRSSATGRAASSPSASASARSRGGTRRSSRSARHPSSRPELRARMEEAAVAAARSVDYVSAGTVEFLLAPDGRFFFLEMNTRIQVEHPVTEMVYGVDLVVEMIRIALGEPMSVPARPEPRGHAVECRIYAEDPARGFAPSPGTIERLRWPRGPGVRVDSGVEEGDTHPPRLRPDGRQDRRLRQRPRRGAAGGCAVRCARHGWKGSRRRSRSSSRFSTTPTSSPRTSRRSSSRPGTYAGGPAPSDDAEELALVAAAVASSRESLARPRRIPARVLPRPGGRPGPPSDTANEVPREGRRPGWGAERRGGSAARPERRRRSPSTAGRRAGTSPDSREEASRSCGPTAGRPRRCPGGAPTGA